MIPIIYRNIRLIIDYLSIIFCVANPTHAKQQDDRLISESQSSSRNRDDAWVASVGRKDLMCPIRQSTTITVIGDLKLCSDRVKANAKAKIFFDVCH